MPAAHWVGRIVAVLAAIAAFIAVPAADNPEGLSLRVTEETAPPGGFAQMKFELTEPKPISTGRGRMTFAGFSQVDGIAVFSPADDTFGVAVVEDGEIGLSLRSPAASLGTLDDYPMVTVTGRVPGTTPMGAVFPFNVDRTTLDFRDAAGALYPADIENGSLRTAPGLSISEVRPGSADVPAGGVVTVIGTGFVPATDIDLGEAEIDTTRFVSSTRIDVVLEEPARMHGMRIRARNPVGPRVEYFSYQRTTRKGTTNAPVMRDAVPLFPLRSVSSAIVDLAEGPAGLAVQNIQTRAAKITADLFASDGVMVARAIVKVPANRFIVREISELFGASYGAGSFIRVAATRPVQVMGIAVSPSGTASPLLPR